MTLGAGGSLVGACCATACRWFEDAIVWALPREHGRGNVPNGHARSSISE